MKKMKKSKMKLEINRENLVEKLKTQGYIKTKTVEKAFLETPRENFIPENQKQNAYADTPLSIGEGQTISAPHMVAIMCEELDLEKGQKILEIGAGSGYHAAIVSKIIGEKGHVYTIERFPDLANNAEENLKKENIKNVTVKTGDGSEGLEEYGPYDRVYITCAAPEIPPPLLEQLKDPGKIMVPIGNTFCMLTLLEKNKGKTEKKNLGSCAFVPLVGKHGF